MSKPVEKEDKNTKNTQQENASKPVDINEKAEANAQKAEEKVDTHNHHEAFAPQESALPVNDAVVKNLEKEVAEQKDKYLRLLAEFDNYKRRTAKENMEIRQTAGKDILISMLDVLDDCDRAEEQLKKDDDVEHIKKGVELVFDKFRKVLASKGVKEMDSVNQEFDADKHEAITQIPVTSEDQKGKVVDQVQKGYYLNDKLIRYAKVVVGK